MIKAHTCLRLALVSRSGDVLVVLVANSGVIQALWLAQEVLFAVRDAAWLLRGGFAC